MNKSSGDFEWNDAVIDRLRVLWGEAHSTAEIGRRLGVSKNAVIGKAARLHLPKRPSPIKSGKPPVVRPAVAPTPAIKFATVQAPGPEPRVLATKQQSAIIRGCCWPIGEPGQPTFRFCDAQATSRQPYCPEHARKAYLRRPETSGSAAIR